MQLIDRDEAIINFGFEWDDICPTRDEVVAFLRKQKTIDAQPVVHGEWIFNHMTGETAHWTHCSKCGHNKFYASNEIYFNYCPFCGAKMDIAKEDG